MSELILLVPLLVLGTIWLLIDDEEFQKHWDKMRKKNEKDENTSD